MNIATPNMQELLTAGVHFGHKVSRAHPKMRQFIFGARDGISVIDLAFSEKQLNDAALKAYELGKEGKVILIVGTKKQARDIVKEVADKAGVPFLNQRWIGGMLTNFDEVKKNMRKLTGLRDDEQKGKLSHYTKKERLLLSRKIGKFERDMGGAAQMESVPQAMFIVDAVTDKTAILEGRITGLLLLGISDTNADPTLLDYAIAGNDDGIKSIKIICDTIVDAYIKGKKDAGDKLAADEAKKKADDEKAEEIALNEKVLEEAEVLEEMVEKEAISEQERRAEKAIEE